MMRSIFANEGSGGPSYSSMLVEVSEYDMKSNGPALRILATSPFGGSIVLCQSSARKLIAELVAAFPERRKSPDRRKA